jgi:hypothetical protein
MNARGPDLKPSVLDNSLADTAATFSKSWTHNQVTIFNQTYLSKQVNYQMCGGQETRQGTRTQEPTVLKLWDTGIQSEACHLVTRSHPAAHDNLSASHQKLSPGPKQAMQVYASAMRCAWASATALSYIFIPKQGVHHVWDNEELDVVSLVHQS